MILTTTQSILRSAEYNQLTSDTNCKYYLTQKQSFYTCENIDKVDTDLRVLVNLLLQNGYKIHMCTFFDVMDDAALEKLYDTYKKEEKQIQTDGLHLYYLNGEKILVKQENYEFNYPTKKYFLHGFSKHNDYAYITFADEKNKYNRLLLDNISKFDGALQQMDHGGTYFELYFRYTYRDVIVGMIRRYTQIMADLFKIGDNNEHV